jgi:hypothetical protein
LLGGLSILRELRLTTALRVLGALVQRLLGLRLLARIPYLVGGVTDGLLGSLILEL